MEAKASSLRRGILRPSHPHLDKQPDQSLRHISRKAVHGFDLIPCQLIDSHSKQSSNSSSKSKDIVGSRDACVCYTLPIVTSPTVFVHQRVMDHADLKDFEICNRYNIDNTCLVYEKTKRMTGNWLSEEVLAYYCLSHTEMFRHKRVMELGSGYGLAGLVIAAVSEALEVVMETLKLLIHPDIQRNMNDNSAAFGDTKVKSLMLHWDQQRLASISSTFDVIVTSDCTFFQEFHKGLAQTLKLLLEK